MPEAVPAVRNPLKQNNMKVSVQKPKLTKFDRNGADASFSPTAALIEQGHLRRALLEAGGLQSLVPAGSQLQIQWGPLSKEMP